MCRTSVCRASRLKRSYGYGLSPGYGFIARSMGLKFRFGDLLSMIEALCWTMHQTGDTNLCFAGSTVVIRSLIFACILPFPSSTSWVELLA